MEEIEKLRARVEKDPSSRLFLPLAEEYRKSGMPDEAIPVLLNGLERQPGYTSARVALGKIYLEKNMIEEAKNEFEKVVSVIPDNLYAHKKLADIYRDRGETQKAIAEYNRVIQLNPLDDEAKASLSEIEETSFGEMDKEIGFPAVEPAPPAEVEEANVEEAEAVEIPATGFDLSRGAFEEPEETITSEAKPAADKFEEFEAAFSEAGGAGVEEGEDMLEIAGDLSDETAVEDIFAETAEATETPLDLSMPSEPSDIVADIMAENADIGKAEATLPTGRQASPDTGIRGYDENILEEAESGIDLTAADSFVAEGSYYKALELYKGLLNRHPGDKHILQRIAELKTFMKMIGKGDEVLIANLEAFLVKIKSHFSS